MALSLLPIYQCDRIACDRLPQHNSITPPFYSVSEMLLLHRDLPTFRKRKYPPEMGPFKIRSPLEEMAMWLHLYGVWLFASPLVLAYQALPTTETEAQVILKE